MVLSDPNFFFPPKQRNQARDPHLSLKPSTRGRGDVSPVPKGPVRLRVAIPIEQREAFTSPTALSGSNWHSQDPWGQLKTPHVVTPWPSTQDTPASSSQLALRNPTYKCHGLMITPWAREENPSCEQGELIPIFRGQAPKYPFVEPNTASLETGTTGTSGTNGNN